MIRLAAGGATGSLHPFRFASSFVSASAEFFRCAVSCFRFSLPSRSFARNFTMTPVGDPNRGNLFSTRLSCFQAGVPLDSVVFFFFVFLGLCLSAFAVVSHVCGSFLGQDHPASQVLLELNLCPHGPRGPCIQGPGPTIEIVYVLLHLKLAPLARIRVHCLSANACL